MPGKKTIKFIFENDNLFVKYTRSTKGKFVSLGKDGYLRDSKLLNNKILIKSVYIDQSMKKIKPKSFASWFKNCYRLLVISGLDNLCGDDVKTAASMFENCYCLQDLNFGNFKLPSCTRYDRMFYECKSLRSLNAPKLKFLTKSAQPFFGCNKLNKCHADISVIWNLPLYDNRSRQVCNKFDAFGAKITNKGQDVDALYQEILNDKKNKKIKQIEKEILDVFFSSPNNNEINKLLGILTIESAQCGLKVFFDWNNGIFKYDFLIENLTDKTQRKYVKPKAKKHFWSKKIH